MMVFLQNELQNSGGNPIHGDPGWSNTHILTKNVPNISIIQITSVRPFEIQSRDKYPFRTKHEGNSSK